MFDRKIEMDSLTDRFVGYVSVLLGNHSVGVG